MEKVKDLFMVYLIIINIFGIGVMAYDKIASKKLPKHRVRERNLIWLGILGGSYGIYMGMVAFRHKILHKKFSVGVPLILALQFVTAYIVIFILNLIGYPII